MWKYLWVAMSLLPAIAPAEEGSEPISEIVVTSQRRPQSLQDHAGNIARLDADEIARANPQHINELLHRAAGVWIVRGSGQEHQTSMRSPVLGGAGSCGAFLVLEDGIPIRPANFCNGNQLIEVGAEQASAVEVIRGPGNALYGSNALHGTVNVLMPVPGDPGAMQYGIEYGSNDYLRLRTTLPFDRKATWVSSLVLARDGGFREDSGYRQGKLHVKRDWSEQNFSLALSATVLRQDTAGFIFGEDAYKDRVLSSTNPNPEAYRDADSARLYGNFAWQSGGVVFDVRPFMRYSSMEFLHHALPGQPIERNGHASFGAISAATFERKDLAIVIGADVEWSDMNLQQTQSGPATGPPRLVETRPEGRHYDYSVASLSLATFMQADYRVNPGLKIDGGLRLEYAHYDYDNQMISGNTRDDGTPCGFSGCLYTRPADRTDEFLELSPNVSASISVSDSASFYVSVARGYRMPQTLELYRLQNGQQVADIDPETIDSAELGLRTSDESLSLDMTIFVMKKQDSVIRDALGFNVNGASSLHRGVETDITWQVAPQWRLSANASYALHQYDFTASGPGESFRKGNDIDTAPRLLGSAEVQYAPRNDIDLGLQLAAVGPYFLEPGNQVDYEGHVIANFRAAISRWSGYGIVFRINNLADTRYADRADFAGGNYRYLPGREREFFIEFSRLR